MLEQLRFRRKCLQILGNLSDAAIWSSLIVQECFQWRLFSAAVHWTLGFTCCALTDTPPTSGARTVAFPVSISLFRQRWLLTATVGPTVVTTRAPIEASIASDYCNTCKLCLTVAVTKCAGRLEQSIFRFKSGCASNGTSGASQRALLRWMLAANNRACVPNFVDQKLSSFPARVVHSG